MSILKKIRHSIVSIIAKKLFYKRYIKSRELYAARDIEHKLKSLDITPIDHASKERILKLWEPYNVKIDWRWYNFFNSIPSDTKNIEYYIPHDIYYTLIDSYFSDIRKAKVFDDKNMYDMYFNDIFMPRTIVRVMNGIIMDDKYQFITLKEAVTKCTAEGQVIIKPSTDSEGGQGIMFWDNTIPQSKLEDVISVNNGNLIVQEIAKQCDTLNHLHKDSINTVRVISLIHNGEVKILSSILRMGVNNAKLDNAAAGGIFCGIKSDGQLKECAYNTKGMIYHEHPQGGKFSQYHIPNFHKCTELVQTLAPRLSHISRLCSWDLYIDDQNQPRLIEVNLSYGDVQLHQITNGPIFGDMTPEILGEVFSNKTTYENYR